MILGSTTSTASTSGTGQAAADKQRLDGDLNRFLTLLVSQLQHQDPLQPLDTNQFTSQLVQFASVEQQIYQNANLEKMLTAQQNTQLASTVGYIGKQVEASGNALVLQDGKAVSSYTLPETASKATLTITNAAGRVVLTTSAETASGSHHFQWNGRTADGTTLPDGVYSLKIQATNKSGASIEATQSFSGTVTGVANDQGTVQLSLGDKSLPLDQVIGIHDTPSAGA